MSPLAFEDAYDCRLTVDSVKVGLMLAVDPQTGLKQWNEGFAPMLSPQQNADPFSSQSLPPEIDVPTTFDDFSGGAGYHHVEGSLSPNQYDYSQGVDASWPGRLYLSPERRSMSGITTAPVQFYYSPTNGLYCLNGRYIHKWDISSASWVQKDAAGAGVPYINVVEMDGVMYAALGATGYKYSTDGTTWTLFSDSSQKASYFSVRSRVAGSVLFKMDNNFLITNTTNGQNGGVAWSAADEIGHSSETTTSMVMVDDAMFIFKTGHLYKYSGTVTTDLLAANYISTQNGANALVADDSAIYAPWGDRLLRYDPYGASNNTVRDAFGYLFPPLLTQGNPEITGVITALASDALNLYMAVKNGAGNTYILKGSYAGVWHTWVYLGANDCNALLVVGPNTAHATSPALLAGYGATAVMFLLPRAGYNPESDPNYTFDTGTGTIIGPWVAVNAHAIEKFLNQGAVVAEFTTAARPVVLRYEVDGGSTTTLATATSDGRTTGTVATQVPFVHIRYNTTMLTGDKRTSPRVVALSLHSTPNPPRKRLWTPVVLVADDLPLRDGTTDEYQSESFIRTRLMQAPSKQCQFQDRDGSTYVVRVLDVQKAGAQRLTQGGMTKDVALYQLRIVEIGLITDASLSTLVWNEGAYDSGKVWS